MGLEDKLDIINIQPLIEDWECPKIIGREEQISRLNEILTYPLINHISVPSCIYVSGLSGSGKTFVIQKFISDNLSEIKKVVPNFLPIYINAKMLKTPSFFCFLKMLIEKIEIELNIDSSAFKKKLFAPNASSGDYYLNLLKLIVKENKICLLIIADEIDKLIFYEKNEIFLYIFLDMYIEFGKNNFSDSTNNISDKEIVGISTIFISNDVLLLEKLKHETRSRIRFVIRFNDYSIGDIYQILRYISVFALSPERNYENEIKAVAVEIGNTTHSIRDAKELFLHFLKIKNIDKAYSEVEKNWIKEDTENLGLHEKLFLYSIVKRHSEIINMQKSKNVKEYGSQINPTIGSIYNIYKSICNRIEEKPKTIKTFWRILPQFEKKGLIQLNVKGMGRGKGRTMFIYLNRDIEIIKPIIYNEIEGLGD